MEIESKTIKETFQKEWWLGEKERDAVGEGENKRERQMAKRRRRLCKERGNTT